MLNKKVLLRERKRHTARRVVSTPSVVLPGYPPRGGVPGPGYPPGGVPDLGTPPGGEPRSGYPPRGVPDPGTPPGGGPGPGYPRGEGVPDRTPLPPVDRQTPVKTVPSRRTTYTGGKNNVAVLTSVEFFYNSSFPAKSWQDPASIIHIYSGRIYLHMIQ